MQQVKMQIRKIWEALQGLWREGESSPPRQSDQSITNEEETMTTCSGQITGTVQLECEDRCCKLQSVTVVTEIVASTIADLMNQIQALANSYESQGYPVLAHSMVDSGPNWVVGLTIGYCEGEQPPSAP